MEEELAEKQCYPIAITDNGGPFNFYLGLTFKERLVIALASNPVLFQGIDGLPYVKANGYKEISEDIMKHADAIIKEFEKENKNDI